MSHIDWEVGGGRLKAGGASLEWACFGEPSRDAPTLVLLHEGLGCLALWRDFPQRLAVTTGLPIFAYSRAGYGQSDPATLPRPMDFMRREAIEVLPEILADLGVGRYVLFGHSDGATIAAEYAGRVADPRLAGLVLIAPHFWREEITRVEIDRVASVFETSGLAESMAKYHRDPAATFHGWADAWLSAAFGAWSVSDVIANIQVPVLGIQGAEDQYGSLAHLDALEANLPTYFERLVLPNCRHSPHQDCPEAVLRTVARFLQECAF